jgi:hypothetical protein
MNYLIKQFAIDCAGQKEWDFPKDPKSYTFTPDELTKFAELIVRECLRHAKEVVIPITADAIESKIKEHFGVES